jgi:hypothetical protein
MGEDATKHYRKLAGGGAIALIRDGQEWVWRYRSGPNVLRTNKGITQDWPESTYSTIDELAAAIHRKIDYPDYVDTLPTPRRREAIMATREKL